MAGALRLIGTCQYLGGLLTPWRPAYRVSAERSGHRFFVTARDVVGRHISKYGAHEADLTGWIERHLGGFAAQSGIVVDVGANLGWHTIHAAKAPSVETVICYEPDAFNAWLLDRNIEQNDVHNAVVNTVALGARCGTADLFRYKSSNKGRHSLAVSHGLPARTVPITTLDDSLRLLGLDARPIHLIKIDVEGYEPAVLAGAPAALGKASAVITEFDPASPLEGELAVQRVVDLMTSLHFLPHVLDHGGEIAPADFERIRFEWKQTDLIWLKP